MTLEQVKLFLSMGDDLIVKLNDDPNTTLILWSEDYDPVDPEPFEVRFGHIIHGNDDYTIVRDNGEGLELLRRSHEEKLLK